MNVSDAVAARKSIRAYLDTPVEQQTLARLLEKASRAPSGGKSGSTVRATGLSI